MNSHRFPRNRRCGSVVFFMSTLASLGNVSLAVSPAPVLEKRLGLKAKVSSKTSSLFVALPTTYYGKIPSSGAFHYVSPYQGGALTKRECNTCLQRIMQNSPFKMNRATSKLLLSQFENDDSSSSSSGKANVRFSSGKNNNQPANLSPIDQLFLNLTSDRTSLILGSVGILLFLLNRLFSFPSPDENDPDSLFSVWEASRSRIDLMGVFAAGSVLLNGITKLDVTSVQADTVVLEGVNSDGVLWNKESTVKSISGEFQSTVEWALNSFLKCTPARTAVLLALDADATIDTQQQNDLPRWTPIAMAGVLPIDPDLRASIPYGSTVKSTPILDRMRLLSNNGKESYLPSLQALPGKVEFTYLPSNAQEALILPTSTISKMKETSTKSDSDHNRECDLKFAVVLGGDTAKSFTPRDIAWCREIATWIDSR